MSTPRGSLRHRRRSTLRPRLDDLENRCLLSASIYMVNSTDNGTSGSGDSGTLPYVIGLANNDPNVDGSEIQFSSTVFSSPQTITLANTLALLETTGPEMIQGPAAALTISGGGPSSNFSDFAVGSGVSASITGLTIANGYTTGDGGGVSNDGELTLSDDTLSGDSAFDGGGLLNMGEVTLANDTFYGNSAAYGGGIGNHATVALTNVTIAGNSAVKGGGGIANGATATLNNTLLANNTGGDIEFASVSGDNNLVDDAASAGGLSNGVNGNIVGVNPLLAALGNYGGPTQTMALLPGSPAIDAGDTALAVDGEGNPLTTDQRGLPRVVGAAVDIGAFESSGFTLTLVAGNDQSTPPNTAFPTALEVSVTPNNPGDPVDGGVVTFTAPASGASATFAPSGPVTIASGTASVTATANGILGGPYSVTAATADAAPVSFTLNNGPPAIVVTTLADSPTQGSTSLRAALGIAANLGGSQFITFAPGLTGTISLGSGLEISSSVAIEGPGALLVTVSGGGPSSNFSDFTVNSGVTATIAGLTIANGYTTSDGGGVSNGGDLTLSDDTVTGNSAYYGGGIYDGGTATLEDDTFSDNSAYDGGGVLSAGVVTLINSTLSGNSASFGGGIGDHATVALTNVTIAGNSAVDGGGGIADGGTVTLNNSLLASNSGGDIEFGTVSGYNNLVDDAGSAGGLSNGFNGNIVGVNPLLAALGNYGGPTQTLALLPGSPAIDAGDTALAVDGEGNPLTTDQRGLPRVVGAAVDIGAFESSGFSLAIVAGNDQTTPDNAAFPTALEVSVTSNNPVEPVDGGVVTFTAPASGASATFAPSGPVTIASGTASVTATANGIEGGPYSVTAATAGARAVSFSLTNGPPAIVVTTLADSSTQGFTSLRDALGIAASLGGSQTIIFAPGLTGTISLGSGLEISSSVTIDGPGALLVTVSGGGPGSNFSDFTVDSGVTATIAGLTIANGYTSSDGGGVSNGGDLTLSDDAVTGNSAYYGGGIFDGGTATLEDDTFSDNSAYDGGGVLSQGVVTLINCTLSGNSATYGGGIGDHATVALTNVTIAGNSAADGGGGIADGGTVTLNNSLLASNSGGDIEFGTVSGYNNLIDDAGSAGGLSNGFNGNIVGVDPLLAALANYGGPTQTMALLPGSPAIDAGDTALAVDGEGNPLTTDQRGLPRVVGAAVDIGAFESSGFTLAIVAGNDQSAPPNTTFPTALEVSVTPNNPAEPVDGGVVTFTAPASGASATFNPSGTVTIASGTASVMATANGILGGPYSVTAATAGASAVSFSLSNGSPGIVVTTLADSPTPGFTTLRDALAMAASLGGSQTITFAAGLTGTISLGSGLEISSSVTIEGPGALLVTVSGGGPGSNFSDFTVDPGVTAIISGLTIANGYTTSDGGGVSNGGDLTLSDDTVSGNSAYYGGGVYDGSTATLEDDTFSDNSAYDGGGVLSEGVVTLINSTLAGNSASFGGGIGDHASVALTNVTIAGNSAVDGGGGIADGGTVTLNNSLLASNSGGDIEFGTVSGYNNLIDDAGSAGGLSNGVNGNIVGVNPLLAALGNYGGPTQTLALLPGSPAIDAGDTALAVDGEGNPLTTDQRGLPRVVGSAVDIGAFESSGFTLAIVAGNNQSTPVTTAFPTALEVSVTPNNPAEPVDGGVVTLTAPASGASATFNPSGPVTIASGTASVTATANTINGGPYSVTAATAGASAVSFSLSNTGEATVTSLSSSVNPSVYGESVTLTATVTNASGGGAPTGTVTFMDGSTALGTVQLVRGNATYKTGGLPVGSNTITAVYNGNSTHAPSTSAVLTETVNQDGTATTVTSSRNPSTYGESLTFTAIVKAAAPGGGTPTGTVTFMDGSSSLDTVPLSGGRATFATNLLDAGSHTITVVYSGDGNFVTSTSAPLNETVKQAATTTKVTSSLNPSNYGADVTFTATVNANAPGSGAPTGTVTFMNGSSMLGMGTLSGGVATFSTSTLSMGIHSITAVYSGDANFTASTSAVLDQKVRQGSDATAASSTVDPSSIGWSATAGVDGSFTASTSTSLGQRTPRSAAVFAAGSPGLSVDLAIGTLQNDSGDTSTLDELAVDLIGVRAGRRIHR
jgi:fibronectin-binding autotransporter adhesin